MGRIQIFLTNLGRYVEGCLIGEWVKLPVAEDKLEEVLVRIGINERYEEYFITDYESLFTTNPLGFVLLLKYIIFPRYTSESCWCSFGASMSNM